jgi:outer membrane receptor protein involved in Fe transport
MRSIANRSHRSALRLATGASVIALLATQPVCAQQAQPVTGDVARAGNVAASPQTAATDAAAPTTVDPAQDTQANGTEITVTGSRIQRRDADNVGPLLTLTSDDIAKSGASSVGDLLQKLPSAGVSLNSNGTQGTSYGASSINLRYLGGAEGSGNRVLVLVDGHRWVDAVGQRGFRDFVDLNTIPLGMIDGIEVLKDGASAIYGADAIAGVVNIKTLQPFDGVRGSVRSGITDKGDGAEYNAILNVGRRFGGLSVLFSARTSVMRAEPLVGTRADAGSNVLVGVRVSPRRERGPCAGR